MGNKSNKNFTGVAGTIGAIGALITAVAPLLEKAIDNAPKEPVEKVNNKVTIPDLYRKGFPIDLTQAESMLTECGLKVSKSKIRITEANPKYKDCEDEQVIDSNPRQGSNVNIGTTVCLRYITQDVIDASKKIFEDNIQMKQKAKEKKALDKSERNEKIKENISGTVGAAKNNIGKIFKKERNSVVDGEDDNN